MIILPALLISFVPCIALYLWLRKLHGNDAAYRKLSSTAFVRGIISVLPVILLSALSHILLGLLGIRDRYPLLYEAFYTFIVLALVEEFVKFQTFRKVLRKTDYPYSWLDVTALMTIVALGFGFIESVVYGIGASVPVVLVRGICVPHGGYGFIEGYFYGKGAESGKPSKKWVGFVLAWFIHGLYDFSLSEKFIAINDNLAFVALLLAVLDIALVIRLVFFVRKARKKERYTEPLPVREGK